MDVQVGDVDIHALKIPGSTYVNVVLVVAMIVYIITTVRASWPRPERRPLLHEHTDM